MAASDGAPHAPAQTRSSAEPVATSSNKPQRSGILIVEHEEAIRIIFCELMDCHGIPVWAAANVAEALDLAHQHGDGLGVAVVEHDLPEWNGPLLWDVLRRLRPQLKGCLISSDGVDAGVIDLPALGIVATFRKPLQLDEMLRVLEDLTAHDGRSEQR
jgi:DNA-binding NtrC family response regulator